jgi:O-antigen/teichoic acid export membrane protein
VASGKSIRTDVRAILRIPATSPDVSGSEPTNTSSIVTRLRTYGEQLFASDFVRKVAETYATQIVLLGLSLVTSIAVARKLGPQGRGLYAVAMAMGTIGVQLCNLGLHASNTYYVSKDRALLPSLLGNSLLVSLGLGGGLGLVGYLIFSIWPQVAPLDGRLLWLGLAWIPIALAFLLLENLLLGLRDVRFYNKVEILNRMLVLVFVVTIILCHRTTPVTVFTAMLASITLSAILAFLRLAGRIDRWPLPSIHILTMHFGLGIKAYLIALFGFLLLRIDLFMVKYILGAEQAGYYSIASTMADYVLMLPSVIGLILFPRLSSMKDFGEKFRQAKKATKGTALALLPVLLFAGIAAKPVVSILFGKPFSPAAAAFLWLIPGIFAMGIETALVQFLNSLGYPVTLVWIWFAATILNVLLNLWMIPAFGIAGASAASTICYSLVLFAVLAIVRRSKRNELQPVLA